MGKMSKKRRRKRMKNEREQSERRRLLSSFDNESISENSHSSHDIIFSNDKEKDYSQRAYQGTNSQNTPKEASISRNGPSNSAIETSSSRKRSRRHLDFVYPKKNGHAAPYAFQKRDDETGRAEGREIGLINACVMVGKQKKSKHTETIEQILFASKSARSTEDIDSNLNLASSTIHSKNESNNLEKEVSPVSGNSKSVLDIVTGGKLSGMSVEDAVRDKSGCRPRANSTDGELNLPQRGLCDERMVLQSHKWNIGSEQSRLCSFPKGLHNLGNTCFLNSTLQCLTALPPFCQSLIAMHDAADNNSDSNNFRHQKKKMSMGKKVTMAMQRLFQKVHDANGSSGTSLAPRGIVNMLPLLGSCGNRNGYKFRPGRQEDAHEFLVHLLDAMHDGELREAGIDQRASGWRDRLPISRLDETTFVHRIFGGYFRSQVKCTKCGYCSNTYDPFLDLALEVSKNSICSVAAALKEFTRKETLDSENRWKCSGCNKRVCATKQLTVFRPPLSLCVQLKRFTFGNMFGGLNFGSYGGFHGGFGAKSRGNKISKPIDFPSDLLLPLSDGRSCEYALRSILVHTGSSSDSGHYTAFLRKPRNRGPDRWYHADDSFVEKVSERAALQQRNAYLLFYSRKEVKLEFPSPPPRASMTAQEATEHGRARARARADSLNNETSSKNSPTIQNAPATGRASLYPKEGVATRDLEKERAKTSDLSRKQMKAQEGIYGDRNEQQAMSSSSKSSSSTGSSSSDDSVSSSSDGSSSSSSDDSSSSSSGPGSSQSADDSSSDESAFSSESDNEVEPEPGESAAVLNGKKKKRDVSEDLQCAPTSSQSSEEGTLLRESPGSFCSSANQKSQNSSSTQKNNAPKMAVLDRGSGREKVSVIMQPKRAEKAWKPQNTGTTRLGQEYELLGNRVVDKWNDEPEASRSEELSKHAQSRSEIVDNIEKKNRASKRRTHVDRWDASLDRGRTKKLKQRRVIETGANNSFQRIQSEVQKLRHSTGKRFHGKGSTGSQKKRKR